MKKSAILVLVCACLISSVFARGGSDSSGSSGGNYKLVLRLSHVFGPREQISIFTQEAADAIRKRTNGAIDIQCFPNSQLPVYKDGLEQVARGANFISVEDPSYIGDYVADFNALVGPMMYTNFDEYEWVLKSDVVKDMLRRLEEKNIKVLALDYFFGFRFMKTNKVIRTPADLRGMKIRVPKSQLFVDTLNAMGANAIPLGWDETLSAVTTGVVDGLEGTMDDFLNDGSGDVARVGSLTNHFIGTCGVYIGLDVWNSIPEQYQQIIQEEFTASGQRMIKKINDSYEETKAILESTGHIFNEVDSAAFAEAVRPVYDNMRGTTPGIYDTLKAEIAKRPR